MTVDDVLSEVRRRGLSDQDFRDEIRRQIMEGKLIELRVRPRVRVTEQDAHAAYQHWLQEVKNQAPVEVRVLALRVLPGLTQAQIEARQAFALTLAQQAQTGKSDFCELVRQYSDDVSTRSSCGSHGAQPFRELLPAIQTAVRSLAAGSVSDPIPVHLGNDEAVIILQLPPQAKVQPYDEVKAEMTQRALLEGLERARKQWLEELRRNIYIDVRLWSRPSWTTTTSPPRPLLTGHDEKLAEARDLLTGHDEKLAEARDLLTGWTTKLTEARDLLTGHDEKRTEARELLAGHDEKLAEAQELSPATTRSSPRPRSSSSRPV